MVRELRCFEQMNHERSEQMLRLTREVYNDAYRESCPRAGNFAEQLSGCLLQLRPFWAPEHVTQQAQRRNSRNKRMSDPLTINSFEILKPISRGAYGQVVLAAKKTTRDLYAIKVVRKRDTRRKNNVQRIKTERQVLATAENPFVVKLFYSFQSKDNLYMVMEFVNGGDLFSLLKNVGYLEEPVACVYVAEIALALEYLHFSLNVVHRDIKPENVLIHQDGHIKLTDFGLSAFGLAEVEVAKEELDGEEEDAQDVAELPYEAELRAKVGTPDYMAPELLLGERHGRQVDLWSLGCLAFELLTGYTPFTASSTEEVFDHILAHHGSGGDAIRWPEEEDHFSPEALHFG